MIRYFLIFCLFFPIYAKDLSNIPLKWYDENECCYSFKKSPKSVLEKEGTWSFSIDSCKKNLCGYRFYRNADLTVFCSKIENYCKITDSFVLKVFPTKKQIKDFCNHLDFLAAYYGQPLSIPFEKEWDNEDIIIGCDFISNNNIKQDGFSGFLLLNGVGSCPIWAKVSNEYNLYLLQVFKNNYEYNMKWNLILLNKIDRVYVKNKMQLAINDCKGTKCKIISTKYNKGISKNLQKKFSYFIQNTEKFSIFGT